MIDSNWNFYEMEAVDSMIEETDPIPRQSRYNTIMAVRICATIARDPRPISVLAKHYEWFPSPSTVSKWRMMHPVFDRNYNAAKKCQVELLIDEIIELCDDPANCEPEVLAWAKERIKTRQWLAKKLLPHIYGDKQQTESTVTVKHEESIKDLA